MEIEALEHCITLAYFCPVCRQAVLADRSLFSLLASATELSCPCGKSHIRVEVAEDKCRLAVPCLFCNGTHTVTCSLQKLVQSKALAFSCKASGLACCYIGQDQMVRAAMARLQQVIDKLDETRENENQAFLDEIVMQEVLGELKEIAARDGISCACGSHQWRLKIYFSSIEVSCAACGAAVQIPAATADDIDDICCKNSIYIKKM